MTKKRTALTLGVAILVGLLAAAAERPAGPLAAFHLKVVDEKGELAGEYVIADDHDATPPAVLGLLQTRDGYRAQLRFTLDREEGVVTKRFLDLQSGWWIERQHDFGVRNLGGPEDFEDPQQWVVAFQERQRRLKPVSTYALTSSDGAHTEWTKAWDAPEVEVEKARSDALAAFAADLAQTEVPPSALAELKFLAALIASPEGRRISQFEELVEETMLAVRAARGSELALEEREFQVEVVPAWDRADQVNRLMKMLDTDESEREKKPERKGSATAG